MALDPDTRQQLFKTARLWLLALICASVGAYVVWRTDDIATGVYAFLTALGVFGLPLWAYERSRRRRDEANRTGRSSPIRGIAQRRTSEAGPSPSDATKPGKIQAGRRPPVKTRFRRK